MDEIVRCYFDICKGEDFLGRVIFELFPEVAPKAVENFRALCRPGGYEKEDGSVLEFKGTIFHKVIKNFMIQGGDILHSEGAENATIFGELIPDESFELKHRRPGLLGLCNMGPGTNTNGSQFYITTVPAPHLDGEHMIIGKVIRGMDVVHEIEEVDVKGDQPKIEIRIEACGEIFEGDPEGMLESEDGVPDFPEDLETKIPSDKFLKIVEHLRQLGNSHFKQNEFRKALRKWHKTARYLEYYADPKVMNEIKQHKVKVYCNIARVTFKLQLWQHVVEACHVVLAINPMHPVALYKRGDAFYNIANSQNQFNKLQYAYQDYSMLSKNKQFASNAELHQKMQEIQKKMNRIRSRGRGR